jgi:hypothetical protein
LLIAGTFPNINIRYSCISSITVKKLITRKKPAGIRSKSYFKVPQRLNAGDLTYVNKHSLYSITRPLNQNYYFSTGPVEALLPDITASYITGLSDGESSFTQKGLDEILNIKRKMHSNINEK